jgi:hypothetical protein
MAPFFAASREDFASVFGRHPLEKTVDAFAATVMRLKGPLHLTYSLGNENRSTSLYRSEGYVVKEDSQFANSSCSVHTCG